MARVTGVYKPADYPGVPDEATAEDLQELFAQMFPGQTDPQFDDALVR